MTHTWDDGANDFQLEGAWNRQPLGVDFLGVNTGVNIEEGVQGEAMVFLGITSVIFLAKKTMIEGGWSIEKTKPTGVLVLLDYPLVI